MRKLFAIALILLLAGCVTPTPAPTPTSVVEEPLEEEEVEVEATLEVACENPSADQQAIVQFIDGGCYQTQWQADASIRLSGGVATDGTTYTVHENIKVFYSPDMLTWMETNRPDGSTSNNAPIPDSATMIAEVYGANSDAQPNGYLTMVHSSESWDGWYWSQYVTNDNYAGTIERTSDGKFGFGLCASCHSSAVSDFTFANYQNVLQAPEVVNYTPNFEQPNTASLDEALTPPQSTQLHQPLDDAAAQTFIDFFNQAVPEFQQKPLPSVAQLPESGIVAFPSQYYDHVFLTSDRGFLTSDQCQACHDATGQLLISDGAEQSYVPPNMAFKYNPQSPSGPTPGLPDTFNLSQYGEWSVSIMALAARDPVFHTQIETERVLHLGVEPTTIDNVCYRCHGPMGQRQYHIDQGGDPTQVTPEQREQPPYSTQLDFSHFMIYSTPDSQPGDAPPYNQPTSQPEFAKYGALARDGVSCMMCHTVGPDAATQFNGDNWEIFYGYPQEGFSQLEDPKGFDYPLTSNMHYDLGAINAPPPDLNRGYVGAARQQSGSGDAPTTASIYGHTQNFGVQTVERDYLPATELCSTCHVVIVPKVPMDYPAIRNTTQITNGQVIYQPGTTTPITATLPNGEPCGPAPLAVGSDLYDPTLDPCLDVSYEQTTFFEWASSSTFGQANPQTSCTACHMPDAQGSMLSIANIDTAGIGDSSVGAFPEVPYRADSEVSVSSNSGYARHRLMGINLFVHQMFQQFTGILGLTSPGGTDSAIDRYVPEDVIKNLLNAEESILTHAPTTVSIEICMPGEANTACDDLTGQNGTLTFRVAVRNQAGHRFPTGAGFRRGFLEVRLLDVDGNTLWVSGSTNAQGAIVDGATGEVLPSEFPPTTERFEEGNPNFLQPHYGATGTPSISQQDQVQIYETRATDEFGVLTTSTIRLFGDAKDNRIPPAGWIPPVNCNEDPKGTEPSTTPGTGTYCENQGSPCALTNGLSIAVLTRITSPDPTAFTDPDFCTPNPPNAFGDLVGIAGVDHVLYAIPLADINGEVATIEVTMQYQATPPYFIRDRLLDAQDYAAQEGNEGGVAGLGTAAERFLYIISHLDTNITNAIPEQENLPEIVSSDWTMHIGSACVTLIASDGQGETCPHATLP